MYFDIFESIQHHILIIDKNYKIVNANKAFCTSVNLHKDEIIGKHCYEVTHKTDIPCWEKSSNGCPVYKVFAEKKTTKRIHKHNINGKIIFEEIIGSPIFNKDGEVEFVIEELQNISELLSLKEVNEHFKKEIATLRSILPICALCKKIRNSDGYWEQIEVYLKEHADIDFSHGYCEDCAEKVLEEIQELKDNKKLFDN